MLTIGPHMSTAKGYVQTAENVKHMGANTFQFFSRNPRGSSFRTGNEKDVAEFQRLRRKYGFGPIQAHAPYTMNLASPTERVMDFSRQVFREDVARMDEMKIEYFCLHPGSHLGSGIDEGIRRISEGMNQGLTGKESITVLLETMPGKGTEVGFEFSHLKQILERLNERERLGVCMDLCHVFSAGYDIKNHLERVLDEFDKIIGIEKLKTIHLNDSMMPFADRKDRHSPIGKGHIGLEAVTAVITHPLLRNLPFYIETPLDNEEHRIEIIMLREAIAKADSEMETEAEPGADGSGDRAGDEAD